MKIEIRLFREGMGWQDSVSTSHKEKGGRVHIEHYPIEDAPEEYQPYIATLIGIPHMHVCETGYNPEEAFNEVMISLRVLLLYNSELNFKNTRI